MENHELTNHTEPIVKIEEWILVILIGSIPIINIVMLIYWSISKRTNTNKKNFSRALLLYLIIIILIAGLATLLI